MSHLLTSSAYVQTFLVGLVHFSSDISVSVCIVFDTGKRVFTSLFFVAFSDIHSSS